MRKALAVIYCPRCGAKLELEMAFEKLDDGGEQFYDADHTCKKCKARYTVYASGDNQYISVASIDYSDNPYKFIKEDI